MPLKPVNQTKLHWSLWAEIPAYILKREQEWSVSTLVLRAVTTVSASAFHASALCSTSGDRALATAAGAEDVQVASLLWHRCGADVDRGWLQLTVNMSPKKTHLTRRLESVSLPLLKVIVFAFIFMCIHQQIFWKYLVNIFRVSTVRLRLHRKGMQIVSCDAILS